MSGAAETAVQAALLAMLRSAPAVKAVFGTPARVFDDESEAPAFPYAQLERHECLPSGASETQSHMHKISIAVLSRDGGLAAAQAALSSIRAVIEGANWAVPGRHIVLAHVIYADVMRRADRRAFRGLIRIRIVSEEVT